MNKFLFCYDPHFNHLISNISKELLCRTEKIALNHNLQQILFYLDKLLFDKFEVNERI